MKQEIATMVAEEHQKFGSLASVANKTGVSKATISQMINQNWELISNEMWMKVAGALGWKPEGWQLVDTTNTRMLWGVFDDAREERLFMAVSHKAGSGKTASSRSYTNAHKNESVYMLQAREWGKKEFLINLCKELGISAGSGYVSGNMLVSKVIDFFQQRARFRPLLIIDEADKLRPAALRSLIPLYNALEDKLGCVILGTDNLEKEIRTGVRYNRKGMDELDSRFGRRFIHLMGATIKDVRAICAANGIKDRKITSKIFEESKPRAEVIQGQQMLIVDDLRRVRRAIQRELLTIEV